MAHIIYKNLSNVSGILTANSLILKKWLLHHDGYRADDRLLKKKKKQFPLCWSHFPRMPDLDSYILDSFKTIFGSLLFSTHALRTSLLPIKPAVVVMASLLVAGIYSVCDACLPACLDWSVVAGSNKTSRMGRFGMEM